MNHLETARPTNIRPGQKTTMFGRCLFCICFLLCYDISNSFLAPTTPCSIERKLQGLSVSGVKRLLQDFPCFRLSSHLRGGNGKTMQSTHDNIPIGNAAHNFGTATSRDDLVYGSFRPGFSESTETRAAVKDEDVSLWADFMKSHGIKRVICLLNDEELEFYRCVRFMSLYDP